MYVHSSTTPWPHRGGPGCHSSIIPRLFGGEENLEDHDYKSLKSPPKAYTILTRGCVVFSKFTRGRISDIWPGFEVGTYVNSLSVSSDHSRLWRPRESLRTPKVRHRTWNHGSRMCQHHSQSLKGTKSPLSSQSLEEHRVTPPYSILSRTFTFTHTLHLRGSHSYPTSSRISSRASSDPSIPYVFKELTSLGRIIQDDAGL